MLIAVKWSYVCNSSQTSRFVGVLEREFFVNMEKGAIGVLHLWALCELLGRSIIKL